MKSEVSKFDRRHVITASEIGEFAYCAKAWHLKRCGEQPRSAKLAEGETFHAAHGAALAQSVQMQRVGKMLAWLALLLLIGWLMLWFVEGGTK